MTSTTMNSKSFTPASASTSGMFNTLRELFAATPLYIFIMTLRSV